MNSKSRDYADFTGIFGFFRRPLEAENRFFVRISEADHRVSPWWKRHGRTGVFLVSAVVISVLATLLASGSRDGGNSNSVEQELGGQNTSSESPIIPQTNTEESPSIPETNATAEVSGLFFSKVILDQIICWHIV